MDEPVSIRPARAYADYEACVQLQRAVWRLSDLEITSTIQLIATTHAGGSLLLAFDAEVAVGFAYAFPALRGGTPHLHSDMLAVLPDHQRRGLGVRLKWAQRDFALAQGVSLITWTYDPLQARNAHLNINKLGATCDGFHRDYYGEMGDAINAGDRSDRLVVRWTLDREPMAPPIPASAPIAIRSVGPVDAPVPEVSEVPEGSEAVALQVPRDHAAIRAADPALGARWREPVGSTLETFLGSGMAVVAFDRGGTDGRPTYYLARDRSS